VIDEFPMSLMRSLCKRFVYLPPNSSPVGLHHLAEWAVDDPPTTTISMSLLALSVLGNLSRRVQESHFAGNPSWSTEVALEILVSNACRSCPVSAWKKDLYGSLRVSLPLDIVPDLRKEDPTFFNPVSP
jgi:hypothetical protein